jgi:hypothetical protein
MKARLAFLFGIFVLAVAVILGVKTYLANQVPDGEPQFDKIEAEPGTGTPPA